LAQMFAIDQLKAVVNVLDSVSDDVDTLVRTTGGLWNASLGGDQYREALFKAGVIEKLLKLTEQHAEEDQLLMHCATCISLIVQHRMYYTNNKTTLTKYSNKINNLACI